MASWVKTFLGVLVTKIINQSMSAELQTGYKCEVCNVVNVVWGDKPAPTSCIACGDPKGFTKVWSHILRTTETTEEVTP